MELTSLFETAVLIGQCIVALCVLIGILRFKALNTEQRILFILIALTGLVELASRILWMNKISNLFLYHIYAVVEFSLLSILYTRHLKGLIKPVFIEVVIVGFILFAILNSIFFQSLRQFNSNVTFIECLLLIILSILYFYKLLRDLNHKKLEYEPMFWISMSVLTYFSGALILFHVANDLIPIPEKERVAVWGVHALFNIVHYLLYAVALFVNPYRR